MPRFVIFRTRNVAACLAVLLPWAAALFFLRDRWLESYNAASTSIWTPAIYLGGVVAALSALRAHRLDEAERNSVSQTSPRPAWKIATAHLLCDVAFLAILPTVGLMSAVAALSKIAADRGYLDHGYAAFASTASTRDTGAGS